MIKKNKLKAESKRRQAPKKSSASRDTQLATDAQFWSDADIVIPGGKTRMTVRFDTDVVDWFKAQGPKYQTRMNSVLRNYVEDTHRRKKIEQAQLTYPVISSARSPVVNEASDPLLDALMLIYEQLTPLRKTTVRTSSVKAKRGRSTRTRAKR